MKLPEEYIEKINKDVQIETFAPDFLAFSSVDGSDVYVFNNEGRIFLLPLIGMGSSIATEIAPSWSDFKSHIKKMHNKTTKNRFGHKMPSIVRATVRFF